MRLVYDPRWLPGVMTARPGVPGVLHLSHPGFTFLALCLQSMEDKRETKRACSPSKEGSPLRSGAKTPSPAPSGSPPSL
jgi:hypothetical protein